MSEKNFTVYKSSAGSGKTFTLVKEYLALALNDASNPPQAYKHILAITFTNKAASEMKERIIKALKELSENDYAKVSQGTKTLIDILKEHKKLNAVKQIDDKTIRTRAQNILTAILHNYSDFAIGTIDSFVYKVIRTFAFDLKIPMSFEIEMDGERLLSQTIDLLIAQIGNDQQLTKALIEFTESKTDDEKSWHIESDLQNFAKNLLNEEGYVHIEKLRNLSVDDFFKIKDILFAELKTFETQINSYGNKALEIIRNDGIEHDNFAGGKNGIGKYFTYLSESRFDKLEPSPTIQKNIADDKWYATKVNTNDKNAIDAIKNKLLTIYNNALSFIAKNKSEFFLFQLINKNIYSLAVLNEIEKLMNEYKAENNILHISEFNKMISKIVLNEPVPFIYERLGERYNNYLIDEFQDTSVLQFQNLLPLIDNALASGHFTMLVGDGKQAIYRWRGGEVEQFAMLPKVFAHNNNELIIERETALINNYNPQVLNKNFRSKREVIEFNNAFFKTVSQKLNAKYQIIYKDVEQEFSKENTGGYVQVEFVDEEQEEFRETNRIKTLQIIKQLLNDNYSLKDICILVRKNTDGSDIANYLIENGIEVISADSLLLSNSKEISFLNSLLKYLSNSTNNIAHTEIINFLAATNHFQNQTLNEILEEKNRTSLAAILKSAKINVSIIEFSKMPLYELCEELIRVFNLNTKPNAYVQFFLDEVLNYTLKKNNNLTDFIEYWEEKKLKASLIVPQGMNAVNVMTIHKAKGLEFPVVIVPFANSKITNGKDNLWIDLENEKFANLHSALLPASNLLKETDYANLYEEEKNKSLLDNLNVLYVALTRAEERIYVLSGKPNCDKEKLTTTNDIIAHYYKATGEWQEGKTVYTYGKETKHLVHKPQNQIEKFELQTFNSTKWRDTIKMKGAAKAVWNLEEVESKKNYGVMIHTVLAKIKSEEDVELAVNNMVLEGFILNEEKDNLQRLLLKIIHHPKLKPHFTKGLKIKNEAEIISSTGELFRPDRVIINEKSAVIIDYKTGEEKESHKKQILQYADLLEQMGCSVVEKLLVYIEDERVVEC